MSFLSLNDIKRTSGLPAVVFDRLDNWLATRPYNHKRYILPEYFSDDIMDIPYDTARKAMYWFVRAGKLQINYEIHCPYCKERVTTVHLQMDIPEKIECEDCRREFNPMMYPEFIIVSFSVR